MRPAARHYLPSYCGRFIVSTDRFSPGVTIYSVEGAASLLQTYRAQAWYTAEAGNGATADITLILANELAEALDKAADWRAVEAVAA